MLLIKLIDARRGLHNKCVELFSDQKIAEEIYRKLCDGIEDCETVEAEPTKHGRWIRHKTTTHHGELYCSICEKESPIQMIWRYCPNCGARMDGENNG